MNWKCCVLILFILCIFGDTKQDLLPSLEECATLPNEVLLVQAFLGYMLLWNSYLQTALLEYEKDGNSTGHHCGGSVINEQYILTAAHCVTGDVISKYGKPYRVRLGEYNRATEKDIALFYDNKPKDNLEDINIEEIIPHNMYNVTNVNRYYDIALIRLKQKYTKKEYIKSVCFQNRLQKRTKREKEEEQTDTIKNIKTIKHEQVDKFNRSEENIVNKNEEVTEEPKKEDNVSNKPNVNNVHVVLGWSVTENNYGRDDKRYGYMEKISNTECEKYINITLIESQFCVIRYKELPLDDELDQTCHGDSGGGLVHHETGPDYYLIGIESIRFAKCDQKIAPNVYTNVTQFLPWIQENLRP